MSDYRANPHVTVPKDHTAPHGKKPKQPVKKDEDWKEDAQKKVDATGSGMVNETGNAILKHRQELDKY